MTQQNPNAGPDRLPPHSMEAEQGVLACILLESADSMEECQQTIGAAGVDAFYDLRHKHIYAACLELTRQQPGFGVLELSAHLNQAGKLEQCGGFNYLNAIQDSTPSAVNAAYFLVIVWEMFLARQAIKICAETIDKIFADQSRAMAAIEALEKRVLELSEGRVERSEIGARELMEQVAAKVDNYRRGLPQSMGISSGFPYLDKLTAGFQPQQMIVLAGRPGMGKTSLALDFLRAAVVGKVPTYCFSLEMSAVQLGLRLTMQDSGADFQRWRTGFAFKEDEPHIKSSIEKLRELEFYIDDKPGLDIAVLRSKCRRAVRKLGVKMFVLDYLQLMSSPGGYRDRVEYVAECSRSIKTIAKELEVPFVVLAQMNRDFEKEPNRKPRLSDLKESGAIEQDADMVLFLYAPNDPKKQEDKDKWEDQLSEVAQRVRSVHVQTKATGQDWCNFVKRIWLLIAKQREGPTDMTCQLLFHEASTRFYDWHALLKQKPTEDDFEF
jgi:replicative DNA helicase